MGEVILVQMIDPPRQKAVRQGHDPLGQCLVVPVVQVTFADLFCSPWCGTEHGVSTAKRVR